MDCKGTVVDCTLKYYYCNIINGIYILVIENYNKLKYKTKNNINTTWKNQCKNIK